MRPNERQDRPFQPSHLRRSQGLIVNDYRNNGRKSLGHLEQVRLPRLADVFAGAKVIDIATAAVEQYKSLRLKDGAAAATVNRELAALKRMYRLAVRHGLVAAMPYISLLTEHNVRKVILRAGSIPGDPQAAIRRCGIMRAFGRRG